MVRYRGQRSKVYIRSSQAEIKIKLPSKKMSRDPFSILTFQGVLPFLGSTMYHAQLHRSCHGSSQELLTQPRQTTPLSLLWVRRMGQFLGTNIAPQIRPTRQQWTLFKLDPQLSQSRPVATLQMTIARIFCLLMIGGGGGGLAIRI